MRSHADATVTIQTSAESVLSPPSWFGEVVLLARYLKQQGVLEAINERVRFARRRFGRYEVIDFLVVLFGYAISGERTLEAFYQRLQPFADPFMALFGRDRQPVRSTLSRFLAALTSEPVDTLRSLFLDDLLSRPLSKEKQTGGLADRAGNTWVVFDIDGTSASAPRSASTASGKPGGSQPLRLPRDTRGARGCAVPHGRGHPSNQQEKEFSWRHAFGRRLRTLLHDAPTTGIHCC